MNIAVKKVDSLDDDLLLMFKEMIKYENSISKYFNLVDDNQLDDCIRDFFERIFQRPENMVSVAFVDDKPAGFVIGGLMTRPPFHQYKMVGFIEDIYVKEKFRGKDVAKKLMKDIETFLLYKGSEDCTLFVLKNNNDALEAYKKLGYEVEMIQVFKRLE